MAKDNTQNLMGASRMDRDSYMAEVVCKCKTCGVPITRYYYVGYPFCDKCRQAYKKANFNQERKYRGNKHGQVVHLHKHQAINILAFDDWGVAMCGTKRGGFSKTPIFNEGYISDDAVICIRCIKAFAKQIKEVK